MWHMARTKKKENDPFGSYRGFFFCICFHSANPVGFILPLIQNGYYGHLGEQPGEWNPNLHADITCTKWCQAWRGEKRKPLAWVFLFSFFKFCSSVYQMCHHMPATLAEMALICRDDLSSVLFRRFEGQHKHISLTRKPQLPSLFISIPITTPKIPGVSETESSSVLSNTLQNMRVNKKRTEAFMRYTNYSWSVCGGI